MIEQIIKTQMTSWNKPDNDPKKQGFKERAYNPHSKKQIWTVSSEQQSSNS